MECNHKYVHKTTDSFWRENGRYSKTYTCIDYFFCEKCLDEQSKKKEINLGDIDNVPDWARGITKKVL